MMRYIISLLVVLGIWSAAYYLSSHRYKAQGCRYASRWKPEAVKHFLVITGVSVAAMLMILLSGPTYRLAKQMGLATGLAAFVTLAWLVVLYVGYARFLVHLMHVGDYNSRLRAKNQARRNYECCRRTCEKAGAGETVLKCCSSLNQMDCPLEKDYPVQVRFDELDVLCALRKEERRQRKLREQGISTPNWAVLKVPFERVLMKAPVPSPDPDPKDRQRRKKPNSEELHNTRDHSSASTNVETGKVIPFPGCTVEQSLAMEPEELVEAGWPLLMTEDPADAEKPLAKLRTFAFNLGEGGLKVKDCGERILLRLAWVDERGKKHSGEWQLDKNSPDYRWVMEQEATKAETAETNEEFAQAAASAQDVSG